MSILDIVPTWLLLVATTLFVYYKYGTRNFNFWRSRGIGGPKPVPFVGTLWGCWRQNMPGVDLQRAKEYGKVYGVYDGLQPILMISDPKLIRSILTKDFDHFINRRKFPIKSKYNRKMVSMIRDQEWKDVRSSITPTFTSGKIKTMSVLIENLASKLAAKLDSIGKADGKLDAKKNFSIFTLDVIARCAFGLQIDNLGEADDPFIKHAIDAFNPKGVDTPYIVIPLFFPKLFTLFGLDWFMSKMMSFFYKTLEDVVQQRSKSTVKFNDFIQLASEAIADTKKELHGQSVSMWTTEEVEEIIIAQSAIFLLAGFDTTATTLTATTFLLARNPDVQDKLYDLVTEKLQQFDRISHEMVSDMPYLDQVIHEVLRMYPTAARIERECNKDITYDGLQITKGTVVNIPIYAVHYSEENYQEPEKFDPERWAPENKDQRNPYAFLSFGAGPRNCIGMRFAMEELKIALCTLVRALRFFPVDETPEKLKPKNGLYGILQFEPAVVGVESRSN